MSSQNISVLSTAERGAVEVDVAVASAWLEDESAILLDVREQEELEMEWIPGATPMPLSKLDAKEVADLNAGKIVVICHTGRRSKKAVERLIEYGIKDVYSIRDGLLAWNAAGLDSVDQSALLI